MGTNNQAKLLLALIGICTFVAGVLIFIYPPAIFPDPAWGFKVLRSMQRGSGFNVLAGPDHANIAADHDGFMSWWSPGQYLVPCFFSGLFGISISKGTVIAIVICSLSGLAGLYVFFKKLGFTNLISAISIAFIACQQAYLTPFIFYNGGEITVFAFLGWFLYGCTYFKSTKWQLAVFIFLSGLLGFFLKSSFLWIYLSGVLYLWIRLSLNRKLKTWLVNGIITGIPACVSLMIIYIGYLSKGSNPASSVDGIKLTWQTFSFPIASPLVACFSVDDMANGIINQPVIWTVILALLSIGIVIYIAKRVTYANYRWMLAIFYIAAVLFFGISYLRQANISYEARHLRLIGLIITPGIIYTLSKLKRPYIILFAALWLFIVYKSYRFMYTGFDRNAHWASHGNTGFAQVFIDQPMLSHITMLDKQQHNALFVFLTSDLVFEINNNRVITFEPGKAELGQDVYNGHAGPIYVMLPKSYEANKVAAYLKNFKDYTNFTVEKSTTDYVLYSAQ
jgi:hypothetical protein